MVRKRERIKLRDGSFTVETALVMPIILFTVFGILWLFFFVHNRAFLSAAVWESAVLGSMEEMRGNGDGEAAGRERLRERMESCFFKSDVIKSQVSSGDSIRATVMEDLVIPVNGFSMGFEAEGESLCLKPLHYILRCRALGGTG